MKLLFDIGNTRIKWAFEAAGSLQDFGAATHRGVAPDAALSCIADIPGAPTAIAVVNVAGPDMETAVTAAIEQRFGVAAQFLRTAPQAAGVSNGYTASEQLGADRWAAIVGAWNLHKQAVCVADMGTAVTIDTVTAAGVHQGGIILPGVQLMLQSLHQDTSDIAGFAQRSRQDVPAGDWFGRDTLTAVNRGAVFALRAAVAQAAATLATSAAPPLVVITGGDAELLGEIPDCDVRHDPHLVLRGLGRLLRD